MADHEPANAVARDTTVLGDTNWLHATYAFKLGYFCNTLDGCAYDEDSYGPVDSLHAFQEAVDTLADAIRPNVFSELSHILEVLNDLAPALLQTPNLGRHLHRIRLMTAAARAQRTDMFAKVLDACDANSIDVVDVPPTLAQWRDASRVAISLAYEALPRTSSYMKWFNCGYHLGCLRMYPVWNADHLDELRYAVHDLPDAIFEADPWLQQFCEADPVDNSRTLMGLARTNDHMQWTGGELPKVFSDLGSFSRFLFVRILSATHDKLLAGERRVGHPGGGAGGNAGAADQDLKPPTLKWDETSGEPLIDGKKIQECPAEIIRRTGTKEDTFRRDAFLYTESMRLEPYEAIIRKLAKHTEWEPIGTVPGIKAAARRFAARFHLPPVVSRTSTRSKDASR